jgi:uncharacterized membrane protein HdeD (DUF308 family)
MIILGVILLIVGFVTNISILYTIGLILVLVGVVLWILGATGHAIGRARWY